MTNDVGTMGIDENSLRRYRVLESRDPDETRMRIGQYFKPHRLAVLGRSRAAPTRMDHLRLGRSSVSLLSYGSDVQVDPEWLDFYLVQIPLTGSVDVQYGGKRIECADNNAVLISPGVPYQLRWSACAEQVILTIARSCMENYLRSTFGRDAAKLPPFESRIDLGAESARALRSAVAMICRTPELAGGMAREPRVGAEIDRLLAAALVAYWSDRLPLPAEATDAMDPVRAPRFVRRAEEYLRAHLDADLTAADVAAHVGVSVRSLQAGFRRYRDTTPMTLLRELRLDKVRMALADPAETASVGEIAARWGFVHMSHFAAMYRKRFGEKPTGTRWR